MKVILYIPTSEYLIWNGHIITDITVKDDIRHDGRGTLKSLLDFLTLKIATASPMFKDLNKIQVPVYFEDFEIIEIGELPN